MTTKSTVSDSTTPSPTSGVKQEHSDDEEEETSLRSGRVLGQTKEDDDNDKENDSDESKDRSMQDIIVSDLLSGDETVAVEAIYQLHKSFAHTRGDERLLPLQGKFFSLGGHLSVAQAMNKFPHNVTLQSNAIGVLTMAIYKNSKIVTAAVEVKGMEAILAAMKSFPQEWKIQVRGLDALSNLVRYVEKNATLFVEMPDGISSIIRAMENFGNHFDVVFSACHAFACLFVPHRKLRKLVHDKHPQVVTTLAKAYYDHTDDEDIEEEAREALKFLMSD